MPYQKPTSFYRPMTLKQAKAIVQLCQENKHKVYVVRQMLVTEEKVYGIPGQLSGEALARSLGVQTVDEEGTWYWPRHPVIAWVQRQLMKLK